MTVPQPPRAPLSEATLRVLWRKYRGAKAAYGRTVRVQSFSRLVADPAYGPWKLFGEVCTSFGYEIEKLSMWVVRYIGGTTTWSQHAYGATGDVNYYLRGKNGYNRGWSWDKTDFTPELVDALLAIRTNNGKQVFAWGGTWRTKQDYMHWYPGCGPKDYLTGIDMDSIKWGPGKEDDTMKYFLAIFAQWTPEDVEAMRVAGYWSGNTDYYFGSQVTDEAIVNLVVHILANGNKDIPPHAAQTNLLR